jgi:16S rRNA (guanine966-N2)-methyltransferase
MRVIAGSAGGIPLRLPKTELRPTMDMVRGAIFSSLGEATVGARVLDLFAGTGSLAIEALSRGAESATLVEADRKACEVIAENLKQTRLKANILCMDVFRFLEKEGGTATFDLIFADPPYAKDSEARDFAAELLRNQGVLGALQENGLLVLEVGQRWVLPECAQWECVRRKRYGSTETLFLRKTLITSVS